MISPIPRFFGSSDSLDYANRWRVPHKEPPSHRDRKSCSTQRGISSPVATRSITRIAGGAHTRSCPVTAIGSRVQLDARSPPQRSEVVFNSTRDLLPRSWIWVPEHRRYGHPLRFNPTPSAKELDITFRTGIGIAYVTIIRNRHSETVDRTMVSQNSVPGPKFPPGACCG
ncbi:hypothetical protein Taro_011524 [Colocasia esculenta]|uniref:Uncharacterized protein n=1 Tax=Colocasia esculenta TaxID=4460 RepID=A0A843UAE7_COLES|nr:hypothetical protein [Colocasia esculenta]